MADGRPPSRIVLVFAGLFTQLGGAACLVLGLASFPVIHDLHRPVSLLAAWIAAAIAALVCGGLSYRARVLPLAIASLLDAGFGYALPRKDSALGALAQLVPEGDLPFAETIVTVAAIAMFVFALTCVVAIWVAVRYRRWEETDEGIRVSRAMMAVPAPEDTLKGVGMVGGKPAMKTLVIHTSALEGRSRWWVIAAVAVTLVGTGGAAIVYGGGRAKRPAGAAAGSGTGSGTGSGSATAAIVGARGAAPIAPAAAISSGAPPPAGSAVPAPPAPAPPALVDSPAALVAALHDALARGDAVALAALLDPDVLAVGVDATELSTGRDGALAILAHDLGAAGAATVEPSHTTIGRDGALAWIAEDLAVTPSGGGAARHLVTSVIARAAAPGQWSIAALTWAVAVPNGTAFKLARDRALPVPVAVPDQTTAAPDLAESARAAFGSRDGFVAARSKRADAFNFGSAPGERMIGGEMIRRAFSHMTADMGLHDGVAVGRIGDRAGWSEANVDFTAPDQDGAQVTQTFRVLAAWVREDGAWRIVHSQFSNAKPR